MSDDAAKTATSLRGIADDVKARFDAERRVLSFDEYLEMVEQAPASQCRDAATYLRDALAHFGTYEVARPWGADKRYRLFDLDFGGASGAASRGEALVGHEAIQAQLMRALEGFVREGRANRLLLLHGPNGSAKSTLVACLMRGLEAYSQTDAGALYRFSWVFPRGDQKGIGFGATGGSEPESFAHLGEDRLAVKLRSELREHPLLLLPTWARRQLLERLGLDRLRVPDMLWEGALGHKNQQIFEALLTAHRGDLRRVLAHVQVERFDISQRYRCGAITIGPELSVDASERQITADVSLAALPASLSTLTLFEAFGALVSASGGLIEYSDLLKRPLDAWRYLLLAIESGEVSLPLSTMPLNSVMVASGNELQLNAFREHPEYRSFRGRLTLVRMPYLLDVKQEQGIYDDQILPQIRKPVAPHTTYVAALFAVLTRLRRAQMENYADRDLGRIATDLSPIEKAELYTDGRVPERLEPEDQKTLRGGIAAIRFETPASPIYEGITGASAREIRSVLLDAAADPDARVLTPLGVLERLSGLVAGGDYAFLRLAADRGYHDANGFVDVARDRWLDRVEQELREATGLVAEDRYLDLFARYANHVSHWVKKEQLYNPVTKAFEDADQDLMDRVEEMLEVPDPEVFRGDILNGIANWAIDNQAARVEQDGEGGLAGVDFEQLFPRELARLRDAYFESHREQIATIARAMLSRLDDEHEAQTEPDLDPEARAQADRATEAFLALGYEGVGARLALVELLDRRYA